MKIKICGIMSEEIIKLLIELNIDYAGFILYEKSIRYVTPTFVRRMVEKYRDKINLVGVVVNMPIATLNELIDYTKINFIQLHGDESPTYIKTIKSNINIIKAFRISQNFNKDVLKEYLKLDLYGFLFDTLKKGTYGGTGESFDWEKNNWIKNMKNVFISGGLNVNNVINAIKIFNPMVVDINSGVEEEKGIKSEKKIKEIITLIRKYYE